MYYLNSKAMTKKLLLAIAILLIAVVTRADDRKIDSKVQKVTVFLNGAQVTRTAMVNVTAGTSTLIFGNISPGIDVQSIQVHANGEFTILSVKHEMNYLDEQVKIKHVQELRAAQKVIQDKINTKNGFISIYEEEAAMLRKNQVINGENTSLDITKLKQALDFGTDHLSLYQLTIEPETPFALLHKNGQIRIPDDDLAAGLYETTQELTEAAGLPAYEISNHARPGSESRHNLIYWRYGEYAGVGPGAHGRLMLEGKRVATSAIRLPERWRDAVMKGETAFADFAAIDDADASREHLLMNLRLAEGLDLAAYQARWNTRPAAEKIAPLVEQGLLRQDSEILTATPQGRLVLNAVIAELLN